MTKDDFTRFAEATYPKVMAIAVMFSGNRPDAEDATQDAYAAMYQNWPALQEQAARLEVEARITEVHRYLEGYAVTSMKNALRRAARKHRSPVPVDAEQLEFLAPAVSTETWLEVFEVLQKLRCLPPRQQEVLVLRCLLGMSTHETALVLGLPGKLGIWRVNSSLHRARQKLAELLGVTYRHDTEVGDALVGRLAAGSGRLGAATDPLETRLRTAYELLLDAFDGDDAGRRRVLDTIKEQR